MSVSHKNNRALKRVLQNSTRAPAHGDAAKQEAGPAKPAYSIGADIPESYNDAYVRAIPADPQNSFVYWEMPKELAQNGAFGGKGAAHVGNGDADKIRETLVRQGGNGGGAGCSAQGAAHSVQPWHDNTHQHSRDDNHTYLQDNSDRQIRVDNHSDWHDNTHKHARDDNHIYLQDSKYQHHWWNGKIPRHRQDSRHHAPGDFSHFLVRREESDDYRYGQNYHPCGESCQGPALPAAMAESLIGQCGRHLAECRQGESGAYLPLPSSGELYVGVNNAGSHTAVSPISSGAFYRPTGGKSSEKRP